jgi:hypothetical protein
MRDINFKSSIICGISVFLMFLSLSGCKKECFNKSLGKFSCGDGYIFVPETSYIEYRSSFVYVDNKVLVIDDLETYKNTYPTYLGDSMPLGYIDFTKNSLLAVRIETSAGSGVSSQGGLCFDMAKNKWMFNIEYTLSGQCKGSGISSMTFAASLICPKLPAGAVVEFNARDINPF